MNSKPLIAEPKPLKKLQNRKGANGKIKQAIHFNGRAYYYDNVSDLQKQLGIPMPLVKKLLKDIKDDNTGRILLNKDKEIDKIDITNPNRALLKTEFGIQRLSNKDLIEGTYREKVDTVLVDKLYGHNQIKSQFATVKVYVNFYRSFEPKDILTNQGKRKYKTGSDNNFMLKYLDEEKLKEALDNPNEDNALEKRTLNVLITSPNNSPSVDDIERSVRKAINDKYDNLSQIVLYTVTLHGAYTHKEIEYKDGYIAENIPKIFQLEEWANIEYDNTGKDDDSCAVKFLSSRYPKYYWKFKKLEKHNEFGDNRGIILDDFMRICNKYKLPYHFYDINGDVIYQNIHNEVVKDEDILRAIIFNNHVYPTIGGKKPRRIPKQKEELKIVYVHKGYEKLLYFLDKGILPKDIKIGYITSSSVLKSEDVDNEINVISFVVKKTKYICNGDHLKCLNILKELKLEDKMKDSIKVTDLATILIKVYAGEKAVSFFPEKKRIQMSPLLFNKQIKSSDDICGEMCHIDKNKAYTWSLYSLPYLICFDYRVDEIIENPMFTEIDDKNLYLCIPEYYTLDMPDTGLYTGYDLIRYRNKGIKFKRVEELVCRIVPNYYRDVIDKLRKYLNNDDFKYVMNIIIGKFEQTFGIKYNYKFKGIFNDESAKMHSGFVRKLGSHNLFYDCEEKYENVRDNFPISIQVKSWCRNTICDKIRELNIHDDDIFRINTDSIMYRGKLPKNLDPSDFDGWKKIPIKDDKRNYILPTNDRANLKYSKIEYEGNSTRILHNQYAGGGKTTYIINKLIPKLQNKNISYIVLTPSHETLQEYKKNKLNCEIIHHYVYVNMGVPKEDYVIIDEVGYLDGHCNDIIFKIIQSGKSIECFGDFRQLKGIDGKSYDQEHYLRYAFNKIDDSFTNYRNNFDTTYYDSLIDGDKEYVTDEVLKWSSGMKNAELIICYRHKTKEKYNNLMLENLELEPYSEGTKLISVTNKFNKLGIYNHKRLNVIEVDEKLITLEEVDGELKKYVLPKKKVCNPNNFQHAYAMNIHQVQGRTLKSYYWCDDDNKFLDGRMGYTIISRLRQEK